MDADVAVATIGATGRNGSWRWIVASSHDFTTSFNGFEGAVVFGRGEGNLMNAVVGAGMTEERAVDLLPVNFANEDAVHGGLDLLVDKDPSFPLGKLIIERGHGAIVESENLIDAAADAVGGAVEFDVVFAGGDAELAAEVAGVYAGAFLMDLATPEDFVAVLLVLGKPKHELEVRKARAVEVFEEVGRGDPVFSVGIHGNLAVAIRWKAFRRPSAGSTRNHGKQHGR